MVNSYRVSNKKAKCLAAMVRWRMFRAAVKTLLPDGVYISADVGTG